MAVYECVDELKASGTKTKEIKRYSMYFIYIFIYRNISHKRFRERKKERERKKWRWTMLLFFIFDKCENAKRNCCVLLCNGGWTKHVYTIHINPNIKYKMCIIRKSKKWMRVALVARWSHHNVWKCPNDVLTNQPNERNNNQTTKANQSWPHFSFNRCILLTAFTCSTKTIYTKRAENLVALSFTHRIHEL